MPRWLSFSSVVSVLFTAYIAHSVWSIYQVFHPTPCPNEGDCIRAYLEKDPKLEIEVYTSQKETIQHQTQLKLVWKNDSLDIKDKFDVNVEVELPLRTRRNGSLYVHVFLRPRNDTFDSRRTTYMGGALTRYTPRKAATFNLMLDMNNMTAAKVDVSRKDAADDGRPVTHWKSHIYLSVMDEPLPIFRRSAPPALVRYLRLAPDGSYLPVVFIDEICTRQRDLMPVNTSVKMMPLTIHYSPISVGKLMMWTQIGDSFKMMHGLGFSEKDTDEVKGIFADTNFFFLILTFVVAAFHLLFDFLAFKNDIHFWKNRDNMVGLSTRMVLWRCASTIIIFLYLMDEETSLLVLIPAGVGTIIEIWKVKKAFKARIIWLSWRPAVEFGLVSEKEKETEQFDSQAMKYLSYVLYPLCLGGAVYSLLFVPFKSWYSWCIHSLVNGVYAFGFLFMLPQLFLNYKLKSVAHLPWRAFMYKAFNTFIDDVFAFIITMPTAHRVACFRDDIVFLVYLYQRWLYPVDKTRVNEYGQAFDKDNKKEQ